MKQIKISALIVITIYIVFSFVLLELNPLKWNRDARICAVIPVFILLFFNTLEESQKK